MEKQIHPFVDKRIEDYCKEHTSKESEALRYIDRQTHLRFLKPNMISGNWQGNLLKVLSLLVQPKNVLEIGTFTAYATLCLADGLAEGGVVHTIEKDVILEDFILSTIEKYGYEDRIKLHIGNAMEIIDQIEGDFDLIFIDADKANYPAYFEKCVSRLRSGGLIIADNILWYGKVVLPVKDSDKETKAIKLFNETVSKDPRFDSLILPIRDGIMVARKK
ncbi:MAG: O-methyltransferase [Bacteroidales bacterium]|jgi:predicted O-methyltransferase YrrM|nr:class I SAM-dependent methyltransferase [Bacteroidales bacterium]MEE0895436.1 O-methyltransferase [Bacteroidales bacterium]MEE0976537.1 O-methyltransferase [Bacteroidales bacterium]